MPPTTCLVTVSGYVLTDALRGVLRNASPSQSLGCKGMSRYEKSRWWIASEEGGLNGDPGGIVTPGHGNQKAARSAKQKRAANERWDFIVAHGQGSCLFEIGQA
jgi:hypothetical protein